jgi:hypothetical protein
LLLNHPRQHRELVGSLGAMDHHVATSCESA